MPDLPGHGKSALIKETNTMEHLADIVYRVCLSLGLGTVSVAGHSMGGYVALAFAAKYSMNTEKIYLINSHPFDESMAQVLARNRETDLLKQGRMRFIILPSIKNNFYNCDNPLIKEKINFAAKIALEQPVEGMVADLAGMMARPDTSMVFKKPRLRIMVITGKYDTKFPTERMDGIYTSSSSLVVLDQCGHMCILERPGEVALELLK